MQDELLKPYVEAKNEREATRALDRLSESYLRPLIRSLVRSALSREETDVVQSVLASVCERIRQERSESPSLRSLKGYVVVCVYHETIRWGKYERIRSGEVSLEGLQEQLGQEPMALHSDPVLLLESQETLHLIWKELQSLRPSQRAVLLLDWKEIQEGVVPLLVRAGVATHPEVIASLPLSSECLLPPLPWNDVQIGEALKTTDKTVRTLRSKTCRLLRERLSALVTETALR